MRKKFDEKCVLKVNDKPIYDFLKFWGSLLVCAYADKFSCFNPSTVEYGFEFYETLVENFRFHFICTFAFSYFVLCFFTYHFY